MIITFPQTKRIRVLFGNALRIVNRLAFSVYIKRVNAIIVRALVGILLSSVGNALFIKKLSDLAPLLDARLRRADTVIAGAALNWKAIKLATHIVSKF